MERISLLLHQRVHARENLVSRDRIVGSDRVRDKDESESRVGATRVKPSA